MKSIRDLHGKGVGKKCMIVGGGHSAKGWLDNTEDMFVISCNAHAIDYCHLVIFHDQRAGDKIAGHILPEICVTSHLLAERYKWIIHVYKASDTIADSTADIDFGDTGFHAIQIADRIMNFDEIHLYGLDYYVRGDSYHFDEENSDKVLLDKFVEHSIGRVAPKINRYNNISKIYTASDSGMLNYPNLTTRSKIG